MRHLSFPPRSFRSFHPRSFHYSVLWFSKFARLFFQQISFLQRQFWLEFRLVSPRWLQVLLWLFRGQLCQDLPILESVPGHPLLQRSHHPITWCHAHRVQSHGLCLRQWPTNKLARAWFYSRHRWGRNRSRADHRLDAKRRSWEYFLTKFKAFC